jgi:hypothetical protein
MSTIAFGTLVLRFSGLGPLRELAPLYEAHAVSRADRVHAHIDVEIDRTAGFQGSSDLRGHPSMVCTSDPTGGLRLETLRWDLVVPAIDGDALVLRLSFWDEELFDQAIRCLIQVLAPTRAEGLIFHGTSVRRGSDGFFFTAPSETGKTTVARLSLSLGHAILAEEMTYVGWGEDGAPPRVHSLPVLEANRLQVPTNVSAPVTGAYLLKQSPVDRLERMTPSQRVAALTSRAAIGARTAPVMMAAFANIERLSRQVELRCLHFTRSPRFWDVIDADLASSAQ